MSETTPLVARSEKVQFAGIEIGSGHTASERAKNSIRHLRKSLSQIVENHIGRIGFLGSLAIASNSLTGPAMLNLPATFQRAGLIPTTCTVVFVCILSAMCSLHLANTISKAPGNGNFQKEIEFSQVFRVFWGEKWFLYTQILFFCCITCLNVSSIVDTSQVVDTFLGHWFSGGSGAINLTFSDGRVHAAWVRWDYSWCSREMIIDGDCIPFADEEGMLLTIGYLVILAVFLPMALMDLKENASWQVVGFLVLIVTSFQFVFLFAAEGLHPQYLSLWGTSWDTLFGVVLFNFAVVIAVPAWLYEKEEHVDVPTIIHGSSMLSACLYIVIGVLGAMTMPNVSDNMLESMMSGAFGNTMQIVASIFAFFIIGLGTPLFSVLSRQNLVGSGLCSHFQGNLLAVYLPFFSSWMFYQGVTQLLSWGGIIFTSLVAFILPLLISIHALDTSDGMGHVKVYGSWELPMKSRSSQKTGLQILLGLAILSIVAAIVGNIFW